jgi:hypothetical protein
MHKAASTVLAFTPTVEDLRCVLGGQNLIVASSAIENIQIGEEVERKPEFPFWAYSPSQNPLALGLRFSLTSLLYICTPNEYDFGTYDSRTGIHIHLQFLDRGDVYGRGPRLTRLQRYGCVSMCLYDTVEKTLIAWFLAQTLTSAASAHCRNQ